MAEMKFADLLFEFVSDGMSVYFMPDEEPWAIKMMVEYHTPVKSGPRKGFCPTATLQIDADLLRKYPDQIEGELRHQISLAFEGLEQAKTYAEKEV